MQYLLISVLIQKRCTGEAIGQPGWVTKAPLGPVDGVLLLIATAQSVKENMIWERLTEVEQRFLAAIRE